MKEELQQMIRQADPVLMENYMRIFERILLFNIAANMMPTEVIEGSVNLWDKVIKKAINSDASRRTEFLEGTQEGRLAKLQKEPDGEDLRQHCLEQQKITRNVIVANLTRGNSWEDGNEEEKP